MCDWGKTGDSEALILDIDTWPSDPEGLYLINESQYRSGNNSPDTTEKIWTWSWSWIRKDL